MQYAGFGKICDHIFAHNRHPYLARLNDTGMKVKSEGNVQRKTRKKSNYVLEDVPV